jgi:RHS repeat-associated protein
MTVSYDALGRVTRRVIPETAVERPGGLGATVAIAADYADFGYDGAGNLVRADNRAARITRTYFPNGLLETEGTRIRTFHAPYTTSDDITYRQGSFDLHTYNLRYSYDLDGRRDTLRGPTTMGPSPIRYSYDPLTGALASVTDHVENLFTWAYDLSGREVRLNSSLAAGGWVKDSSQYDADGRVTRRLETATHGSVHDVSYLRDARGKVRKVSSVSDHVALRQDADLWYSGLGTIVRSSSWWAGRPTPLIEEYRVDALGNTQASMRHDRNAVTTKERMEYEGDELTLVTVDTVFTDGWLASRQGTTPDSTIQSFTAGRLTGKTEVTHRWVSDHYIRDYTKTGSGYSADGKLRYFERKGRNQSARSRSVIEQYRYDALGRRVLLRSVRDSVCTRDAGASRCDESIQRFVWDGDQLLFETYSPAGAAASPAQLEQGSLTYYRAYTHGPGIDRPLAVTSSGTAAGVVVPHLNWRGLYDAGTTGAGSYAPGRWPGRETDTWMDPDPDKAETDPVPEWNGSLVSGKQDNSGLMYMRNRYYDPKTGRFTQEDPIGLAGGLNLYGYAGGDPVNFSDPFGLCPNPTNPVCSQPGGVVTLGVGGAATFVTLGANVRAGVAMNISTGDAMFFATMGPSWGLGASLGGEFSAQTGSLNDLVAPTGEGGDVSFSADVLKVGGGPSFDPAKNWRPTGGAVGFGGIGAGGFANGNWGGGGSVTTNLYEPARAVGCFLTACSAPGSTPYRPKAASNAGLSTHWLKN